jgi:hypothetical protein
MRAVERHVIVFFRLAEEGRSAFLEARPFGVA